jgi:hypothetical protein
MKVRLFSEEFPDGREADWTAIPREGEIVTFHHRGGGSNLKVESVRRHVETDGTPIEVEIRLTF